MKASDVYRALKKAGGTASYASPAFTYDSVAGGGYTLTASITCACTEQARRKMMTSEGPSETKRRIRLLLAPGGSWSWNSGTGADTLIVPVPRTNRVRKSADPTSAAYWAFAGGVATPVTSCIAGKQALHIVGDGASYDIGINQSYTADILTGVPHSVYAIIKNTDSQQAQLKMSLVYPKSAASSFDLVAGTATPGANCSAADILDLGHGYTLLHMVILLTFDSLNSDGNTLYVEPFGAYPHAWTAEIHHVQIEPDATTPSNPIVTDTVALTRNPDALTVASPLYIQDSTGVFRPITGSGSLEIGPGGLVTWGGRKYRVITADPLRPNGVDTYMYDCELETM